MMFYMQVSLRDAYLYSLRSHLLKNAGQESNLISDSDLENLFQSSSADELDNKYRALPVADKGRFVSVLNGFVEKRGHLPTDSDLVPPALKIQINQDGLEKLDSFISGYKSAARELSFGFGEVDFRSVVDLAKEVNLSFEPAIFQEDLSKIDTNLWRVLSDDFIMQVLLPTSNGLFINLIEKEEPYFFDFLVNRRSWHLETSFLDNGIWTCDATLQDQTIPINSQTYKNYALVDKSKCVAEGLSTYLNLIVSPLTKSHAILNQAKITPDLYSLLFTYKRVMKRQAAFARDMIMIKEWMDANKDKAYGMSEDDKYRTIVLSENSPLKKSMHGLDRENVQALIISSFSSNLSGLISEMEELVKNGKPELGTMAFLDFYGLAQLVDPRQGGNINNICSFLSLKFINEFIDNDPKASKLVSGTNLSNLSERAPELISVLKEIRSKNLN